MESILVTGAGGGAGQSILKSLQDGPYRVVGADGDALGTGVFAVPRGYRIPYAKHAGFVDRLLEIAQQENCRLIIPGLDAELPVLAAAADRFRERGIEVMVSSPDVVSISDDKMGTARFLQSHGFVSPVTQMLNECVGDIPFPVILKPCLGGARSQGIHIAKDRAELEAIRARLPNDNYVAQEMITGDEYTCGSVNFGGRCFGAIAMRRQLRDGDTYKAFIVKDDKVTNYVISLMEKLKPFGACNTQLRIRDGIPYVFEFNARCSGTTYSRTLAGFNEPLMVANYLLRGETPRFDVREISILRYWKELVVENDRIQTFRDTGVIEGVGSRL